MRPHGWKWIPPLSNPTLINEPMESHSNVPALSDHKIPETNHTIPEPSAPELLTSFMAAITQPLNVPLLDLTEPDQ
jgi:hypothetical protein